MKLGLSLCGGGSKGAYELGVWDALIEMKMEFEVVTGTSIGSLNAAMYVQGDYKIAEELWTSVKITNVIENGFDIDEMNLKSIIGKEDFKSFIKSYVKDAGTDVTPFKELLKEYLNFDKIRNSKILFGACSSQFPLMQKQEILINELNDEDMFNYILASCSMFPFFPVVKIHGKQYVDGAFSDNLPIEFAFKLGATKVVAVDLSHKITHKEYLNNPYVEYIYPKYDLGSFLHFQQNVIEKNRTLGYYDAHKHFGKYEGFMYTFELDRQFVKEAKILTLDILNDSITFKNNNNKTIAKKPGYKDIFSYLNTHIHRKITDYDYFIKCLEELCLIFELEADKLYNTSSLITKLKKQMDSIDTSDIISEFITIKSENKKRDFLHTCDKKAFAAYLYKEDIGYIFKMFLLQSNIELYLVLVLLESIR